MSNPFSDNNPYNAPQSPPPDPQPAPFRRQEEGDATGGVIPYKNVPALISYYAGIFSLLPCAGMLIGIAALILGIMGLRTYYANKAVHGIVHAWIGIILGGGSLLAHLAIIIVIMIASAAQ